MAAPSLAVSVVVYHPDDSWLNTTLSTLAAALRAAHDAGELGGARVLVVDNQSSTAASPFAALIPRHFANGAVWLKAEILAGHGNVGYGAGNNLAMNRAADADFHLVLNPDVDMDRDAVVHALRHLADHAGCAMVTPVATAPDAAPLYLVKGYPTLSALLLRGFAPAFIRGRFQPILTRYERADVPHDAPLHDARIVSGCFMLTRRSALDRVQRFDPDFFLYFEDFDLSYRISEFAEIHRVPACRIVHGGGNASRKGLRHIGMFVRSAARFFSKHGWRL